MKKEHEKEMAEKDEKDKDTSVKAFKVDDDTMAFR